jgi:hypothetical protein
VPGTIRERTNKGGTAVYLCQVYAGRDGSGKRRYVTRSAPTKRAHTVVWGALTQAVRLGWVPINVAAHASPPRMPKRVIRTPKPADVGRLVADVQTVDPELAVYLGLPA